MCYFSNISNKLIAHQGVLNLLNRITGMSYAQIARHCGITAKTVEKHIARALQGLRQELGPDPLHNDRDNE